MTDETWKHLGKIRDDFDDLVVAKYVAGQNEHGGQLWKKKGLIDMAIDEAVDQVVYLLTLKKQIEDSGVELGSILDEA